MLDLTLILFAISMVMTFILAYRIGREVRAFRSGVRHHAIITPEQADMDLLVIRWTLVTWVLTALSFIIWLIAAVAAQ